MFPLKSPITCSSLISCKENNCWTTETTELTAGSTHVYGEIQKTTAMKSKLKRKVMAATTKIHLSVLLSALAKEAKRLREKKIFNLIKKAKNGSNLFKLRMCQLVTERLYFQG